MDLLVKFKNNRFVKITLFRVVFTLMEVMMQIKITINLKDNLMLPINYNHIITSIIYKALSNKQLHNSKDYKLFTFSKITGKYIIINKKIIFTNKISFEVRSINKNLITQIYYYINKHGINILNNIYKPNIIIENKTINNNEISINSNICTIKKENNKTIYIEPNNKTINNNFRKKYYKYYHKLPTSNIELISINYKKEVTTYKNIYIKSYNGNYILKGNKEYLNFLYNVGLGSKNSQGFGLFNIK